MIRQKDLAKIRKEKLWKLFQKVSEEYGGDNPDWLWSYCEAVVYGNNKQFMDVVNALYDLSSHAPAVMALCGDPKYKKDNA